MITLETWDSLHSGRTYWRLNECLETSVSAYEVRTAQDFASLAKSRVLPLIWLAMPGHEDTP